MGKNILFIIPDYSSTTLRMLKVFENLSFSITLVVPYKFGWQTNLLYFLFPNDNLFIKKIKRRNLDWEANKPKRYKTISAPIYSLLYQILKDKYLKRFYFSNSLKEIIQTKILYRINFKKYQYLYSFDTISLQYFSEAQKNKLFIILESRVIDIDFVLNLNEIINKKYNISLDTTSNSTRNEDLSQWYNKIRTEPKIADLIIVYSEFQKFQFEKIKKPTSTILKIPIASRFHKSSQIKSFDSHKISFLFVGRIVYSKGIKTLLEAWKLILDHHAIDNFELNIIGNSSSDTEHLLIDLPKNVYHHNYMFEDELKLQYEKAHVLIHPTFFESYGMIILEAMSYNMPVITTQNCGASELLEQNKTGFVYSDIFSSKELATNIEKFITSPQLIQEMSINLSKIEIINDLKVKEIVTKELYKKL